MRPHRGNEVIQPQVRHISARVIDTQQDHLASVTIDRRPSDPVEIPNKPNGFVEEDAADVGLVEAAGCAE